MNLFKSLFLYPIILIAVVRCPSKNNEPASAIIPIKGDPMIFIKNAKMDASQGIPAEVLTDDSEWFMSLAGYFTQEQVNLDSMDKAKEEYKPKEVMPEDEKAELPTFKVNGSGNKIVIQNDDDKDDFVFELVKQNSQFMLKNISIAQLPIETLTIHHYSITPNNETFNILTSFSYGSKTYLFAFNFFKKKDVPILETTLDSVYRYLNGPGVSIKWDQSQPLKMSICEHEISFYNTLADQSVKVWNEPLEKRLSIDTEIVKICPPFSDLNTHIILHINDWVEIYGPFGQSAHTMNFYNYYNSEIVDSTIIVLEKEWEELDKDFNLKFNDPEYYSHPFIIERYKQTMTHEMGHSLGLDHIFDGTSSIMNYDNINSLQEYDIKAIQALYPLLIEEETTETDTAQ